MLEDCVFFNDWENHRLCSEAFMDGGAGAGAGGGDKNNKAEERKKYIKKVCPGSGAKTALITLWEIFGNFLDEKHHLAADKFV